MVSLKVIQRSNMLLGGLEKPIVAVFAGGTAGVGKATIEALVETGAKARVYLMGRGASSERAAQFKQKMQKINPKVEIIWVQAEIALLGEVRKASTYIIDKESHVDLLFMSAGYAPFSGRKETSEGLEITQSLEFYTRILLTQLLMPLLLQADAPRVVSVLAGGLEPMSIPLDDLDLNNPSNLGAFKAQGHYSAMGSLVFERLAEMHPKPTFVHSFPGWVKTGNHRRGADPDTIYGRFLWPVFDPLIGLLSFSEQESGQRHLFESTNGLFGGHGTDWDGEMGINSTGQQANGLFLVNQKCDCVQNARAMNALRQNALEAVWTHTAQTLKAYL